MLFIDIVLLFYTSLDINILPKVPYILYLTYIHWLVETFWRDYVKKFLKAFVYIW